jgi:arylsulfatase
MADSERLALSLPENRLSENVKPQHLARAKLPKEWIDKFKGKFDQGWDKVREETLARQKQMGIVPQNTLLAPKPAGIKDWDTLSPNEKKVFERQMEVYAGWAAFADEEVGRLAQALTDDGLMDNTIFLYILGDNGGSPEARSGQMGALEHQR